MAKPKEKKTFNSVFIGITAGLIAPLITLYFFYLTKNVPGYTFEGFLKNTFSYGIISQVLSICMFGNLGVFFLFIWSLRYKAARGVIMSTLIYALATVIYKIF